MGSDKRIVLPRLTAEEEKLKKLQEQKDENERAVRSSLESLQQATVRFNHISNEPLQMPDDMAEVSTMMPQQLGMTAPTEFPFSWGNFSDQEFGSQSSLTAPNPNSNFDSPGEWNIAGMQ